MESLSASRRSTVASMTATGTFCGLVGSSAAMKRVYRLIKQFAAAAVPMLFLGDTGTGKGMAARALWAQSGGRSPFVVFNCASVPEGLADSILFGHERGAFTGAVRQHRGVVERADGGTLFLDELGELPTHAQVKLLRVLESGEFERVGGDRVLRSNFRLIAATNRNLQDMIRAGEFREDLFHRLGAARVTLPHLSERLEDLPELAQHLLDRWRDASGKDSPTGISAGALAALKLRRWPGNVRELRGVIETAAGLTSGPVINNQTIELLPSTSFASLTSGPPSSDSLSLDQAVLRAEAGAIRRALARAEGNREEAAELLEISPATLFRKLRRLREREVL